MPSHVFQGPFQSLNPISNQAAVGLDLGLARTPGADSAAKALQMGPLASEPRQQILMLSEFDLEPALFRLGTTGEYIEDQRRPIYDFDVSQSILQVVLLRRGKFVIANQRIESTSLRQLIQRFEFAFANIYVGRFFDPLERRADHLSARADGQLAKLCQRVLDTPSRTAALQLNTHEIRALFALGCPL